MKVPFIELRTEPELEARIMNRWQTTLSRREFISGTVARELTERLLGYTGANYFVPMANGTDAIQIALRASGVTQGDVVLVPNMTFWATYEAVVNVGAIPVLIDISPIDLQMDFGLFERAAQLYQPKAAILVHLYGWCSARLADYRDYCRRHKICLIEDAAQALGTKYDGVDVLRDAYIATMSFYPAKVLGAAGDAGGLFTSDKLISEVSTVLSNHGRASHYGHVLVGWNSRMDELQAGYLLEALDYLDDRLASRKQIEKRYIDLFTEQASDVNFPIEGHAVPSSVQSNGYLSVGMSRSTYQELGARLGSMGIGTGNTYPTSVASQQGAQNSEYVTDSQVSEYICKKIINLPLFPYMTADEQDYVCSVLRQIDTFCRV